MDPVLRYWSNYGILIQSLSFSCQICAIIYCISLGVCSFLFCFYKYVFKSHLIFIVCLRFWLCLFLQNLTYVVTLKKLKIIFFVTLRIYPASYMYFNWSRIMIIFFSWVDLCMNCNITEKHHLWYDRCTSQCKHVSQRLYVNKRSSNSSIKCVYVTDCLFLWNKWCFLWDILIMSWRLW